MRRTSRPARATPLLALLALLPLATCRNASGSSTGAGAPIVPSALGMNGCSGADQAFVVGHAPTLIALTTLDVGPRSQITAAASGALLYATGANATVVAIDLAGAAPVETELVSAGTVAALLAPAGVTQAPELSGIAVLDADTLVVVEHASNTLLTVDRTTPDTVGFFAGLPSNLPGFADGAATGASGLARFSFSEATQLCPTGEAAARVFVADPGNHAIRVVADGAVLTIAGRGTPDFADGDLTSTFLDTPTGLAVTCDDRLLVSERGAGGAGNRLRALSIGAASPTGGFFGTCTTLAGDGTPATVGGASLAGAELARPVAPLVTATGEIYWIDSASGVLRRRTSAGECDCPLHADCAGAVSSPEFPAGHAFSMAQTGAGKLYVLDATAGTLYRITP